MIELKCVFICALSAVLTLSCAVSCKQEEQINEIDICSDEIREYLNAGTTEEQFFALSNAMGASLINNMLLSSICPKTGRYIVYSFRT